jgi:DNA-binding MarR family transcriptional regulator
MKTADLGKPLNNKLIALLLDFSKPYTAHQLAEKHRVPLARCSRRLRTLAKLGLAACANPSARRSRVYQLTGQGKALQRQLRKQEGLPPLTAPSEDVDLKLLGNVCHRHRAAVLKAMDEPLQPATIKRIALRNDPAIKMSANNVRDVIYWFVRRGIAKPVEVRGKAHYHYELTEPGRAVRKLLLEP